MANKAGIIKTPQPEQWVEDGGHYLPNHQWEVVKQHAAQVLYADPDTDDNGIFKIERVSSVTRVLAPVVTMLNTTKHNGMSGLATQLFVQHDAECPLEGGYAVSLTNWANNPIASGGPVASWHSFVDPIARVRMVPWYYAAWVQGYANPFSIGMEVAGYARFTWAQWRTTLGLQQLENLAHEWVHYWQIEKSQGNIIPLKWLTTDEVTRVMAGNRSIKGFCTHGQIEPASRWDPGPNFPYTELMQRITELVFPKRPEPIKEWDEMATKEEFRAVIREELNHNNIDLAKETADAVGTRRVKLQGFHADKGTTSEDTTTGWQANNFTVNQRQMSAMDAKLDAMLKLQAAEKDISEDRLREIFEESFKKSWEDLQSEPPAEVQ